MSKLISFPTNPQPLGRPSFSKTCSAPSPNWIEASFKMEKAGPKDKKNDVFRMEYTINPTLYLAFLGNNTRFV